MKRILLSLIAVIALSATVIIPLDIEKTRQDSIYKTSENSSSSDRSSASGTSSASEDASDIEAASDASAKDESSGSDSADGSAPSTQADAGRRTGEQQKPAASSSAPQTSARPEPPAASKPQNSQPSASKPQTSKPSGPSSDSNSSHTSRPSISIPESSKPSSSKPQTPETDNGSLSYAQQVVKLVNQERAKEGLSPLSIDQPSAAAALVRAKEIENSFSHTRPNGSSFSTALTEQGARYRRSGENIAWGQKTPEQVMQGWMNSPGHRANIMNPNFTSIGVGYYRSTSGTNYWTQLFIG